MKYSKNVSCTFKTLSVITQPESFRIILHSDQIFGILKCWFMWIHMALSPQMFKLIFLALLSLIIILLLLFIHQLKV